jgi:protein-disulfide isomerase
MKMWLVSCCLLGLSSHGLSSSLFSFKGKSYSVKDLSPALQQQVFDLEAEHFQKTSQVIDSAILEMHIAGLANAQKKSKEAIEQSLFTSKEPNEKETKEWYEQNKARLPHGYKFEQIKGDIKKLLQGEQQRKQRDDLIAKLKKQNKFELALNAPISPKVEINFAGFPFKGNEKAALTLVEFADFQCPHCKEAGDILKKLMKKYASKVRLYYLDFPINRSGVSRLVAHGGYCAQKQDKYWQYHDMAFDRQKTLSKDSPEAIAKELKLDLAKFKTCYESPEAKKHVEKAQAEGTRVGVGGTPTLFLNGQKIRGHHLEDIEGAIEKALSAS